MATSPAVPTGRQDVPVVPQAPDRDVVEQLRRRLEAERAAGASFATAWARSTSEVLDLGWRRALRDTQEAWRAAYEGQRPAGHHGAVWALVDAREAA